MLTAPRSPVSKSAICRFSTMLLVALPATQAAAQAPRVWDIDVARSGTACVADPGSVTFWRAKSDTFAHMRVSGPANFPSAIVDFAAGVATAPLDTTSFPIADGSVAIITDASSGATISQIDFVVIASPPKDSKALAQVLKAQGCDSQAERMYA